MRPRTVSISWSCTEGNADAITTARALESTRARRRAVRMRSTIHASAASAEASSAELFLSPSPPPDVEAAAAASATAAAASLVSSPSFSDSYPKSTRSWTLQ